MTGGDERNIYLEDIPMDEARARLAAALEAAGKAGPLVGERVALDDALGRVTAEPVWALISSPHYHAAAMDGYAVRAADTLGATETRPVALAVPAPPPEPPKPKGQVGTASWYGPGFTGKKTASGEVFDDAKMTAAHKTLPFDTEVNVTNLETGRSVRVRINDRGPHVKGRLIDLSRKAAEALDIKDDGVARVRVEEADATGRVAANEP